MKEINNYIDSITKGININDKELKEINEEAKSILIDSVNEYILQGLSKDKAIEMAIKEFGDKHLFSSEFEKIIPILYISFFQRIITSLISSVIFALVVTGLFWIMGASISLTLFIMILGIYSLPIFLILGNLFSYFADKFIKFNNSYKRYLKGTLMYFLGGLIINPYLWISIFTNDLTINKVVSGNFLMIDHILFIILGPIAAVIYFNISLIFYYYNSK